MKINKLNSSIQWPWILVMSVVFSGCAAYFEQPMSTTNARLGAESTAGSQIIPLPEPREKIVAAVYKFRDQTGQYKPNETGNSFSTAVTQGATSILMRALEESGWFTPIERENIGNLLNERKIIRSSRAEYGDKTALPPLLFAGVILEGGIISYDANMRTGGAGLRYFGAGASGQYREDRVTIYLRAISTSNGKVLKTVYTSKNILSQMVDVGLFRFVKFQRLLEAETGFTYNEPSEMAVKEAIEKAVESLIIEGIEDGLWQLANERDKSSLAIRAYQEEKRENASVDMLDRRLSNDQRAAWGVGVRGGAQLYAGDFADRVAKPGGEVFISHSFNQFYSMTLDVGIKRLATENYYDAQFVSSALRIEHRWFPQSQSTPFIFMGPGLIAENKSEGVNESLLVYGVVGMGYEHLISKKLGLQLSLIYNYVFSDQLDQEVQGKYNDYFWGGKFGLTYYFGRPLR